MTTPTSKAAIEAVALSKSFGPVEVVHEVGIEVRYGEVHAILGENGAGKSTLMKMLSGYLAPSGGEIRVDGEPVSFSGSADAEERGIVLIHQEFNLAGDLSAEENIFLGRELRQGPFLDRRAMRQRSRELLESLNTPLDPTVPVKRLAVSQKQMVEIAKAVSREVKILFMDEPTDVLTGSETEVLFGLVRELRDRGGAIVFVSHKLDEIKTIADRVTILRAAWVTALASRPESPCSKEVFMARPVTLFTGQWADLPLIELAPLAKEMGYDGLELACWGDHFEVRRALAEDDYVQGQLEILHRNGLECYAIGNHLAGQAVCDHIDSRHQAILPDYVWGDGDPEGVRQRAAQEMIDTARAAKKLGVEVVTGFTGSSIWHSLYAFPPTSQDYWEAGFRDFADRWLPILDAFEDAGVDFGLEVHPTEIAFDIASAERALEAVRHHPRFGFNYDPSHLGYQGVDYVAFLRRFGERIYHVHMKDAWWGRGDGSTGVFGGHTSFGDARRYWDFRSVGRGDIDFEEIMVALNDIGYTGPLSIEWEDGRMDRVHGARESAAFVSNLDFEPSSLAFDAAFEKERS